MIRVAASIVAHCRTVGPRGNRNAAPPAGGPVTEPDLIAVLSKMDSGMELFVPIQWVGDMIAARHAEPEQRLQKLAAEYDCQLVHQMLPRGPQLRGYRFVRR